MQTIVGVLRGGASGAYRVSLSNGKTILANLSNERYQTRDIFIDTQGVWHVAGRPLEPHRILQQLDVVVSGLQGEYGENGEIQRLLERYNVPYVGANSFSSYLAMHKVFSKEHALESGMLTPRYTLIESKDDPANQVAEIVRTYTQPVVVKPLSGGTSEGVSLAGGYASIYRAVVSLLAQGVSGVVVEEYIQGREATVGVVEGLRGEQLYALPPIEIALSPKELFSNEAKLSNSARKTCPAQFPKKISEELMHSARTVHSALGVRHYSRSDFIVSPRGVYYLETNTLPSLVDNSLFSTSLGAVGVSMSDFLEHLIRLARG